MNLHLFKQLYALELLPFEAAQIDLGTLVWKEPFRRPNWLERDLPNDIHQCFYHFALLDALSLERERRQLQRAPLQESPYAQLVVTTNRRYSKRFPHPMVMKINSKTSKYFMHTYFFSGLEQQIISPEQRHSIAHLLHPIRQQAYRLYRRFDPVYIVTEVHYGALNFSPRDLDSRSLHAFLEKRVQLNELIRLQPDEQPVYRFTHQNIPFAIKLESINTFKA